MLWVVPVLFGVALALTMWLADGREARIVAAYLVAVWALANAAWLVDMLWVLPVVDLGLGLALVTLWWATRASWVALVADAVAIRLMLHVLDTLTAHVFEVAYIHALNATFAWMLVVVALSGGGHAADTLLRGLRRIRASLSASPARRLTRGR